MLDGNRRENILILSGRDERCRVPTAGTVPLDSFLMASESSLHPVAAVVQVS